MPTADYLIAALKDGQRGIGKPTLGRILHTPIIGLAVPIRDKHGVVIGAVAGAIDLSKANLIERTVQRGVGKNGGFIVISHRDRVCVTATDKSRIMTAVPPANVNPLLDRFMGGFEGYGVTLNSAASRISPPARGFRLPTGSSWVNQPTEQAFASLRVVQRHVLLATVLLSVLAGVLTWMIAAHLLRKRLSPVVRATQTPGTAGGQRRQRHPSRSPWCARTKSARWSMRSTG